LILHHELRPALLHCVANFPKVNVPPSHSFLVRRE